MSNEEFLPEQVPVSVAFGAMAHFLAMHFNHVGGSDDVATFIRTISRDGMGRPLSEDVYDRFKEAVVYADRLEMVDPLRGSN
jgi:hypothetical protein